MGFLRCTFQAVGDAVVAVVAAADTVGRPCHYCTRNYHQYYCTRRSRLGYKNCWVHLVFLQFIISNQYLITQFIFGYKFTFKSIINIGKRVVIVVSLARRMTTIPPDRCGPRLYNMCGN